MHEHDIKIGNTIRQLRERKNMSQAELCKPDFADKICSMRHLSRIENGETTPHPRTLYRLLEGLGVSLSEFTHLIAEPDIANFQHDFSEIWDLLFEKRYEKAASLLDALKTKPYCNIDNPLIEQALLMCDASFVDAKNNNNGCLTHLHKAMRLTSPHVFENNELSHNYISRNMFTLNEYRILMYFAIIKSRLGFTNECILTLSAMCESLNNKKIDVEIKNRLLPTIYYNLSDELIDSKCYEEALSYCEKGISLCKKAKNYKTLPHLYYSIAKVFIILGNKDRAEENFRQSYNIFSAHGDNETALQVKKLVATKYNLWL